LCASRRIHDLRDLIHRLGAERVKVGLDEVAHRVAVG
jgi:hypothetical protein